VAGRPTPQSAAVTDDSGEKSEQNNYSGESVLLCFPQLLRKFIIFMYLKYFYYFFLIFSNISKVKSSLKPRVYPRAVRVGCVVDKVAWGRFFTQNLRFSLSIITPHLHIYFVSSGGLTKSLIRRRRRDRNKKEKGESV
jgi:hypothetical protein